jgi:anthranilate/para-aminobenzoate synthase component I
VYQVNLCQKFTKTFMGNPYELFEHLLIASPSPGLVFMDLGDHQVLSASPEMFLKIQGRHITTRPIKGTRPRHENPLKDEQNAIDLMNDPKELAELLMITDLERNDLGKVCEIGSMKATATPVLETFAQVFHLVSTVEGDLTEGVTPLMAIRSCMPGGSITGAPKIRACEIIKELEPCPRGLYTGALGYFDENGDAAFSIAIRTMILHQNQLSLSVGAGITADSDPTSEYLETIAKARGAWKSLNSYMGAKKTAAK